MAIDPDLTWLRDVEHLRALPQRYSRAIDQRDIDAVAALFHPDGSVDGARGLLSVADYITNLRTSSSPFTSSMHVLGEPLIDLLPNDDTGRMDTYAVVYQLRPSDSTEDDLMLGIRYVDEVVRHQGQWVISHRKSTTLWTRAWRG
jgi:hypothetical protein